MNRGRMTFPSMLRHSTLGPDKDIVVKLADGKRRLPTELNKLHDERIREGKLSDTVGNCVECTSCHQLGYPASSPSVDCACCAAVQKDQNIAFSLLQKNLYAAPKYWLRTGMRPGYISPAGRRTVISAALARAYVD